MAALTTTTTAVSPLARFYYLEISANLHTIRRHLSTSPRLPSSGTYQRSDFTNQPYTGFYEPGGPTEGPLRDAYTPPRITPTALKAHLDAFVVGQERAKRTLATAVYNHYQRIQELQRRDDEEDALLAQEERRRMAAHPRHPVEGMDPHYHYHPRSDGADDGGGSSSSSSNSQRRNGIYVPALTRDWDGNEDEYPGQQQTTVPPTTHVPPVGPAGPGMMRGEGWSAQTEQQLARARGVGQQQQQQQPPTQPGGFGMGPQAPPLFDPSPLTIEKSNILLLGPSGVGKTLMAKTLARVLEVPFSMSDCTPFTQAGYIGEDAEVCVQRLLAAANYDVARAERGIICLDEIDKIATAKVSHGKDVSGEGVQQALLKIIEGTTLQIQAKAERGSGGGSPGGGGGGRSPTQQGYPPPPPPSTNSPLSAGGPNQQSSSSSASGGQKGETYNVKTDNILFICAGAFNGLHKMILDRISKGSIGFGATVRAAPGSSSSSTSSDSSLHETVLEGEDDLFEKHLPYYHPPPDPPTDNNNNQPPQNKTKKTKRTYNTLDLLEPPDLQKYGLIPELIGRIPISCALSSLSVSALVQVLTEPRNSLLKQYEQLFALSSIELRFTSAALHTVAATASKMGTGARGLRTVMERLLGDAMFEVPGSGVKFVLVTEDVAKRKCGAVYFSRGQQGRFHGVIAREEEAWEERLRKEKDGDVEGEGEMMGIGGGEARSFEEYREKEKVGAAGF